MTDEQLLDMRMCDLKLSIRETPLERRIDQLNEELASRGLRFAPHYWLSEDWFSPDGIPGIAIPFYLAHPRLMRLERKQLLEVEGGTHEWCMKILRHEAGHAIDTAFRLRRKASYRKVFGKPSSPYPEYYQPKPSSRDYVAASGDVVRSSPSIGGFCGDLPPSGCVPVPGGGHGIETGRPWKSCTW